MRAVPRVEGQGFFEATGAENRVDEGALPLGFGERFEEKDPAHVESGEEEERDINFRSGGVGEFGPEFFSVRLDDGGVFREGETEAEVGVHVAIGQVVDGLADGPAAGAVRRFELGGGEIGDGGAEEFGSGGDGVEQLAAVGGGDVFRPGELADGVAGVV